MTVEREKMVFFYAPGGVLTDWPCGFEHSKAPANFEHHKKTSKKVSPVEDVKSHPSGNRDGFCAHVIQKKNVVKA